MTEIMEREREESISNVLVSSFSVKEKPVLKWPNEQLPLKPWVEITQSQYSALN